MDIGGVIFDCDGTLVDSELLSSEVIVEMLAKRDIAVALEDVLASFQGQRFSKFIAELCSRHTSLDAVRFTEEFRRRSLLVYRAQLQPIEGALDLVSSLTLEKCVASNGPRLKIETCLEVTGLLPYFEGRIVSAYEAGAWKPNPALIWRAASMMMVEPRRCLLIEDSTAGIEAGLAAGAQVVGFHVDDTMRERFGSRIRTIEALTEIPALLPPAASGRQ